MLPSQLYLDHSHCLVLAPATLAALPSTRAIPDRDVFYVAHPIRSIEATGTSVRQPFGLSTALVRNWSSLFLNRMLNVVSDP
jgi:hypothetical protein